VIWLYGALRRSPGKALRYILFDRERDNFTYDLANGDELSAFVADVLGASFEEVAQYIGELQGDAELAHTLRNTLRTRPDRNASMPFGRRLGWYATLRVRHPRLVVETGVHDGLGSVALLRALHRNEEEGHPGELISVDIDRSAGWLIPHWLRSRHRLVIGDALKEVPMHVNHRPVDVFIHDSDHRYEHETAEFEMIRAHMADYGVLISDNAHGSTAFKDFCSRHGLHYEFWREKPRDHFYPGAGIGITVKHPRTDIT